MTPRTIDRRAGGKEINLLARRPFFVSLLLLVALPLLYSANAEAVVFTGDGATHDPTQASGWALPAIDGSFANFNKCLRCHQTGGIAPGEDVALLRAERCGSGDGRVYHLTFVADDGRGGQCTATVEVSVPKNRNRSPVDQGGLYDSAVCF